MCNNHDDTRHSTITSDNELSRISTETVIISSEQQQLQKQQLLQQQQQILQIQQQDEQQQQHSIIAGSSLGTINHTNQRLIENRNNTKIISQIYNENSVATEIQDIDRLFRKSNENIDNSLKRNDLVTIVTISGCTETESTTGEMNILAHL